MLLSSIGRNGWAKKGMARGKEGLVSRGERGWGGPNSDKGADTWYSRHKCTLWSESCTRFIIYFF